MCTKGHRPQVKSPIFMPSVTPCSSITYAVVLESHPQLLQGCSHNHQPSLLGGAHHKAWGRDKRQNEWMSFNQVHIHKW